MERRYYALAAAVKEHEARSMRAQDLVRAEDEVLYRRLRQLTRRADDRRARGGLRWPRPAASGAAPRAGAARPSQRP